MFTPIVKSDYHLYQNAKVKPAAPPKGLKKTGKKVHSSPALSRLAHNGDADGRPTVSLNQLYTAKTRPRAKGVNPQLRTISEGPERPQVCAIPRRCVSVEESGHPVSATVSSSADSSSDSVSAQKSPPTGTKNPIAQLVRSIRRLSARRKSSRNSDETDATAAVLNSSSSPPQTRGLQDPTGVGTAPI